MDLLPGIVIAIGYFTYQYFYSIKNNSVDDSIADNGDPKIFIFLVRCVVYGAIIGLVCGIFYGYKIRYLNNSNYPVDLIFNTSLVILILFGDKLLLYVLKRLKSIKRKN
jgi:hypothetical protein